MKITCQSCQAKYTIADEKVVGKTVKIKCKKCGAAIVVNANDPGAADAQGHGHYEDDDDGATRVFSGDAGAPAGGGGDEWTVNVTDDDQRTMSSAQIVSAYAAGTVTGDTYVWKDGMSDWLPLSQVPEIMSQVSAGGGGGGAVAATAAAAAAPDLGGTVVMNESAPAAAAAPAAARKTSGRAGQDLFGTGKQPDAAAPAAAGSAPGKNDSKAVGERNENSVLFSLSALTAAEKAASKDDLGPAKKKDNRSGLDDIMNLGGGSLGGPMLAPPPLMAPVVEAPPPPMPMMTGTQVPLTGTQMPLTGTQVPQVVMVQVPEQKKSSTGLIVGIALGVVVAGAAAFFLLGQKPPATTTTENTAPSATATTTATSTAPTPTATDTVATNTTANTAGTNPTPADTKAGSSGGATAPAGGTGGGTGPKPGTTGTTTAPAATTAAPAVTTAAPTAEPPPGEGGKEFNRGAAASALGAASGAAKSCKTADGPTGTGKVKVTFAPSGNVTSAQVQGPPFAGTSVGGCVAGVFRGARVPPFDGSPVSVTKSFTIN